ncbi:MAG TPA: LysM peptidoglycan-binding domain-containing protein [Verrucomicrobiae bacterium]|nr:LysM peptidoglycan-binding domain-containing protein [Verrucomicrobiae bacterium]
MNNSNPFVPQGSLLEQKNKKRARVKVAVFSIFALNILVITPLLIQGCSKKDTGDQTANQPVDTTPAPDTNTPPPLPQVASNAVPATTNPPMVAEPVAPPPPVAPPAPETHEYVITKGDTYYSIAKKFSLKMSDIKAANPAVNPAKLKVGQKIEIPSGASGSTGTIAGTDASGDVYVVKSGDSLTKIAKANGVTVKAIRTANELKTDRIKVGQKLKLPMKAAPADTNPVPPSSTTAGTVPIPQPAPTGPAATASNGTVH